MPPARALCVATGLKAGHSRRIRSAGPLKGLALKHGITVPNTPGTIDSDYRGELKVILINHGQQAFEIRRGDRVAQLVLAPVTQGSWLEVQLNWTRPRAARAGSAPPAAWLRWGVSGLSPDLVLQLFVMLNWFSSIHLSTGTGRAC